MTEMSFFNMGYLLIPLLGGIGVALLCGPLGSVMVWRRLSYFGDTLSHSGLLGITLAFALHVNLTLGVCLIGVCVSILLLKLQSHLKVASDTLLGLLSHTTLALGLLVLAMMPELRVDVLGFLYGDILTVSSKDVVVIALGGSAILLFLFKIWQPLLLITVDAELAQVEGLKVERLQCYYMILLALVVGVALKLVGVLLITALLIIPATAARALSRSPEQMALFASVLGCISVMGGLTLSHYWDLPAGPAIVVVSAGLLLMTTLLSKIKLIN